MDPPVWSRSQLPQGDYRAYRKTYRPDVIRMIGTFSCVTGEGNVVTCEDGWLAIDSQGHPYPIGAAEFESTYEPDDGAS